MFVVFYLSTAHTCCFGGGKIYTAEPARNTCVEALGKWMVKTTVSCEHTNKSAVVRRVNLFAHEHNMLLYSSNTPNTKAPVVLTAVVNASHHPREPLDMALEDSPSRGTL